MDQSPNVTSIFCSENNFNNNYTGYSIVTILKQVHSITSLNVIGEFGLKLFLIISSDWSFVMVSFRFL